MIDWVRLPNPVSGPHSGDWRPPVPFGASAKLSRSRLTKDKNERTEIEHKAANLTNAPSFVPAKANCLINSALACQPMSALTTIQLREHVAAYKTALFFPKSKPSADVGEGREARCNGLVGGSPQSHGLCQRGAGPGGEEVEFPAFGIGRHIVDTYFLPRHMTSPAATSRATD